MKILFVTHCDDLYGANLSMVRLVNELKNYGVQSTIILPEERSDLVNKLIDSDIHYLPSKYYTRRFTAYNSKVQKKDFIKYYLEFFQVRKVVRNIAPDIIYTNSSILVAPARIAYSLNIPHVWHIREFRDMHYPDTNTHRDVDAKNELFQKWLKKSDLILAVSKSVAVHPLYNVGKKIHTIYNGYFSENDVNLYRENVIKDNTVIFCIVGALSMDKKGGYYYNKGQSIALNAFSKVNKIFPNTRLLIVGSGSGREYLENLADDLGIKESIKFLGYTEDVQSVYQRSNVLLSCSEKEAFGGVIVEAMQNSIPVIGHNTGGVPEIVKPNTGFLYSDLSELIEYMIFFVKNPDKIINFGKNARKRVIKDFTIERYSSQVYSLLTQVVNKPSKKPRKFFGFL